MYANFTIASSPLLTSDARCNEVGFYQEGAPTNTPTLVTRLVQPVYDEVRTFMGMDVHLLMVSVFGRAEAVQLFLPWRIWQEPDAVTERGPGQLCLPWMEYEGR